MDDDDETMASPVMSWKHPELKHTHIKWREKQQILALEYLKLCLTFLLKSDR